MTPKNRSTYVVTVIIGILATAIRACPGDELCLACDEDEPGGFCFVCDRSYFNHSSKMCDSLLNISDPHCLTYTFEEGLTMCQECEFGYRLTSAHTCSPCKADNCAICDKNEQCWGCFSSFKVREDHYDCLTSERCPIANCKICELSLSRLGCALCEPGYAMSDVAKRECVPSQTGCLLVDSSRPERCLECLSGFFITAGGQCLLQHRASVWRWLFWVIAIFIALIIFAIWLAHKRYRASQQASYPLLE